MSGSRRMYSKLPKDKWEVGPDYEIIRLISLQSNVSVCEARNTLNNEKVVIKRVTGLFDDLAICKKLLREIMILRHCDHYNIPKLRTILKPHDLHSFNELYIVIEYAPSDIFKVFRSHINLHADQIQVIIYNLLCAVHYLHSANLLHADLKPQNILFYQDCTVKLCSFGNTMSLDKSENHQSDSDSTINESRSHSKLKEGARARFYQAPETIYSNLDYDSSIDVWSIGCIISDLCELVHRNALIHEKSELFFSDTFSLLNCGGREIGLGLGLGGGGLYKSSIISGPKYAETGEEVEDSYHKDSERSHEKHRFKTLSIRYPRTDPAVIYLMENMLQHDPRKRISILEAIYHPYFNSIRDPRKEVRASFSLGSAFDDIEELSVEQLRDFYIKKIQKFNK